MATTGPERGASSAEYTGMVVLATAIVFALATVAPGPGTLIANGLRSVVCRMASIACADAGTAAPPGAQQPPPPPPCTTARREYESRFSTNLLFDRSTSGSRYLVRELSDGTMLVLDTEIEGSGSVAGLGFDIPVANRAVSIDLGASSVDTTETGLLYVLSSPEEIAAFRAFKAKPAIDAYVNGPVVAYDPEYERVLYMTALALADRTYTRVGREVEVKLGAGFRGAYADVELGAGSAKVIEEDNRTGETTVSWEMQSSAAGELGYVMVGEANGGGSGSLTVSMVIDRDGNPVRLEIGSVGQVQGDLSLLNGQFGKFADFADIRQGLEITAGIAQREEDARTLQMTAVLDLTDPATRAAAVRFAERPSAVTGAGLLGRMDDSASLLVEAYQGTVTTESTDVGIALGATLGVSTRDRTTVLDLVDAWSWDPANGGQRRDDCLR